MSQEDTVEGGGGSVHLRKVLSRGNTGGDVVWGGDVGVLAPMEQRLEVISVRFLIQVTKLKEKSLRVGSWRKVATNKVLQGEETQLLQIYLDRRQATVVEWASLRPIFGVCVRGVGYEGGGKLRVPW